MIASEHRPLSWVESERTGWFECSCGMTFLTDGYFSPARSMNALAAAHQAARNPDPITTWGVISRPREPGGSWRVAEGEAGPLVFGDKAMAQARALAMEAEHPQQLWHVIPMEGKPNG